MKTVMTKTLLAAALAATMGVASTSAMAVAFPPFDVTETSVPGASPNVILNAGKITGNYIEVATFTPVTATTGSYDASILWNAGQYVASSGSPVLSSQLGSFFPQQYQMYALWQGSAGYVTNLITGVTVASFLPGGSLSLFIDPSSDTTFTAPLLGSGAWATGLAADDYLIATGTPQSGFGTLNPTLPTCLGGGINCGSFGATSSFALTDNGTLQDGQSYFTSPVPFYNLSFTSGQFDLFSPTSTQTIHGSLDATFGVPEPESLALLGIGLLGLAMARRSRKQA